jgi:hypothetical protein
VADFLTQQKCHQADSPAKANSILMHYQIDLVIN